MSTPRRKIGPGETGIFLTPLEPFAWRRAVQEEPGPACLCLRLLPLARPAWRPHGEKLSPEDIPRLPAALAKEAAEALCAPWVTPEEQAELDALEAYLKSLADYPGLSCAECRRQEERGEGPPECGACPLPTPPPMADVLWEAHRALKHLPDWAAAAVLADLDPRELRILGRSLEIIGRLKGARGAEPARIG